MGCSRPPPTWGNVSPMERREPGSEATARARELRRRATPWEAILWKGLRGGPLRWRRSHPLAGFYLDLYCDRARLAVEADGAKHDPSYDAFRDRILAEAGVLTMRFSNVEIGADPLGCLERIRTVAAARAASFGGGAEEA